MDRSDSWPRRRSEAAPFRLALPKEAIADVGFWEIDLRADRYLTVGPTVKALYGIVAETIFTSWSRDLAVAPSDRDIVRRIHRASTTGDRTATGEYRVIFHDGSVRWLRTHAMTVLGIDGRPERLIGTTQEVTPLRDLLRDLLSSVTGGKLRLVDLDSGLPQPLSERSETIGLNRDGGLNSLRDKVRAVGETLDYSLERLQDLVTGASECGMNAIVHAGGCGEAEISWDPKGVVQVRIKDWGPGIPLRDLPRAVLMRGWSSIISFGHGLSLTLDGVDRLWLLTGPAGTTLVLEQERDRPLPEWL